MQYIFTISINFQIILWCLKIETYNFLIKSNIDAELHLSILEQSERKGIELSNLL